MSNALPSTPPAETIESPRSILVRLRIAVVRMRAHSRTAAATVAELRAATSAEPPATSAPWNVLLSRVNHELAGMARTRAEFGALRTLATAPMKRDVATIRRTARSLERELQDIAAIVGDLRVVRRRETISVLGPCGVAVDAVAETAALEIKTAVFPIVAAAAAGATQSSRQRKPPLTRRGFVLLLASALLPAASRLGWRRSVVG